MLGSCDGSKELGFCGASSSDGLGFATVGNGATSQLEGVACGGAALAEVIGMGGINKPVQAVVGEGWVGAEIHGVGGAGAGRIIRELVCM